MLKIELVDVPSKLGVGKRHLVKCDYINKFTYKHFFAAIRNALSHPHFPIDNLDSKEKYLLTGWFAKRNHENKIEKIVFIDSPDVDGNGNYKTLKKDKAEEIKGDLPNPTYLEVIAKHDKFAIVNSVNKKEYLRVSIIEITVKELQRVIIEVSKLLSEPLNQNKVDISDRYKGIL